MMAKTSAKQCAARYELYSTFAFHFYLLLFYRSAKKKKIAQGKFLIDFTYRNK